MSPNRTLLNAVCFIFVFITVAGCNIVKSDYPLINDDYSDKIPLNGYYKITIGEGEGFYVKIVTKENRTIIQDISKCYTTDMLWSKLITKNRYGENLYLTQYGVDPEGFIYFISKISKEKIIFYLIDAPDINHPLIQKSGSSYKLDEHATINDKSKIMEGFKGIIESNPFEEITSEYLVAVLVSKSEAINNKQ